MLKFVIIASEASKTSISTESYRFKVGDITDLCQAVSTSTHS